MTRLENAPRRGVEATARERAAYHEAGHVMAWLSAPSDPPDPKCVSIEPDPSRGLTGEVRHRSGRDVRDLRLSVGRALSRGKLTALAGALAEVGAEVRAHAAGPVAEAMRTGVRRTRTIVEGECDYWNAYELCATLGLEPEAVWRAEARRARRWLRRRWRFVEHLAELLLRQRPGQRMIAGGALRSALVAARAAGPSPFGPSLYEADARALLAAHRARWPARAHWVVLERRRPRNVAVAWAEDASSATRIAAELSRGVRAAFDVQRRSARRRSARASESPVA